MVTLNMPRQEGLGGTGWSKGLACGSFDPYRGPGHLRSSLGSIKHFLKSHFKFSALSGLFQYAVNKE